MKQFSLCLFAAGLLSMAAPIGAYAAVEQPQEQEKKQDAFDKAGNATEGAMKKAGDGAEKGLDAAGKGTSAAVEHTGRAVTGAAKATGNALKATGSAIGDFFDGDAAADADRVRKAQRALQAKGYYSGPIDGIIGPKTRSGVREFQRDAKLDVTGKINDQTAERLGID